MNSRGLTLIETLAATLILSASAAVCASMLRGARTSLESPRQSVHALAQLADAFMEDPESFGMEEGAIPETASFSIQWPASIADDSARTGVMVSVRQAAETPKDTLHHAWLVFEHDGLAVTRYLALPENEQ